MKNFLFKFTLDQKFILIRLVNLCNYFNLTYNVWIEEVGTETEITDYLLCIEIVADNYIVGDNNVL